MWHSYQTLPFDSSGSHRPGAFWERGETCTRGCWQAQQKKLRQFAQRWFLGQRDDQLEHATQRNVNLGVDRVDHPLEKSKFAIKRCGGGIRESKIREACKSYSPQSVVSERVEVFSITCVAQRAPNEPQRGDDCTICSSCESQKSQDHWQQHLKGKRPPTSYAQRLE